LIGVILAQAGIQRGGPALIAPLPLLVISGDRDKIFPIEATKKAYGELSKDHEFLKASDYLESDFFEGVHEWRNRKTLPFLKRHFGP